ncbi:helix-turn-helix transcriptional regulator [Vibrio cholerae]|nr:helix-turn-helix transcriptional regulator [Vibrio cholerae]EKF9480910.1 helix-turn-helix transcriptional regulator [Vibrio cholerae]ELU8124166.1 helix-turn-helix transcriptional regulator [Vibrio cholerae]
MNIIDGPNQDFALRLCDLRRKAGVTQEELANSIGTDKRSISTYENGRTFPREETLRRLALYFDVDAYWLSTGHSPEMKEFFQEQNQKARSTDLQQRLEFLYIESWDQAKFGSNMSTKIYAEKPTCGAHSNDISLFFPVIKTFFPRYRAIRMPFSVPSHALYKKNAIIVIDESFSSIEDIPSGSDVVFRMKGKEKTPGIRTLIKEPGLETTLVSLAGSLSHNNIEINDINIDLLGVVISVHSKI